MAKLQLKSDAYTRENYFRHPRTGIMFRRIAAGLAWPEAGRPGAALVLGETRSKQNFYGNRHHDCRVLEEVRTDSVVELIDNVARMTQDWMVNRWAVPTYDNRLYLIDERNDELKRLRIATIRYGDPQGWEGKGEGQTKFYHAFVESRTRNEKTLFLNGCTAGDEVRQMDDNLDSTGQSDGEKRPTQWPGAAALYFALAEIDVLHMPEWTDQHTLDLGPGEAIGGY